MAKLLLLPLVLALLRGDALAAEEDLVEPGSAAAAAAAATKSAGVSAAVPLPKKVRPSDRNVASYVGSGSFWFARSMWSSVGGVKNHRGELEPCFD